MNDIYLTTQTSFRRCEDNEESKKFVNEIETKTSHISNMTPLMAYPIDYDNYRTLSGYNYAYLWHEIIIGTVWYRLYNISKIFCPFLIIAWVQCFVYWLFFGIFYILSCFKLKSVYIRLKILYFGQEEGYLDDISQRGLSKIYQGKLDHHLPEKCHYLRARYYSLNVYKIKKSIMQRVDDIQKEYVLNYLGCSTIYESLINIGANFYLEIHVERRRRYVTHSKDSNGKRKKHQHDVIVEKQIGQWIYDDSVNIKNVYDINDLENGRKNNYTKIVKYLLPKDPNDSININELNDLDMEGTAITL